jgi:hypothetical protein
MQELSNKKRWRDKLNNGKNYIDKIKADPVRYCRLKEAML